MVGTRYIILTGVFPSWILTGVVVLQINADGVKRNFYPGDKLPLWHEEMEPHNSLLDILAAGNPDPMVQ